jgi:hypothetical protein
MPRNVSSLVEWPSYFEFLLSDRPETVRPMSDGNSDVGSPLKREVEMAAIPRDVGG